MTRGTQLLHQCQSFGQALTNELRKDVESLAGCIGERNTRRYDALLEAERFIEAAFREADLPVSRQGYLADGRRCHNLIAEIGPGRNTEVIVIGAHYDSIRGGPGANDNASGIAALLHLARTVGRHSLGRTVRLVAFVNEERPYLRTPLMGSAVYASLCRRQHLSIAAMLSLETIGYYPALDPPDHDP